MRVLFISYFFPPYNAIGAVRVGKLAKFFHAFGHDVRVVTARDQPLQPTLPLEIPEERVHATSWVNVNRPAELALGGRRRVAAQGFQVRGGGRLSGIVRSAGATYKLLTNLPDGQIGWGPFALRAASALVDSWRPDLIYASGLPWTSLVVADRLSRRTGIPWVAEFRDLWIDSPLDESPPWRRRLERRLARRVMASAAGFVTVGGTLAESLAGNFGLPGEVVLNGYDEEDYPAPAASTPAGTSLRIVYTGMIYEGKRDPSPLFAALRMLGPLGERVRVVFYGRYLEIARRLAAEQGVEHLVEVHDQVGYREALRLQSEADLLLLLLWDNPGDRGTWTGKVFEYLGARRPIVVVGPEDFEVARAVVERGAGAASVDPARLAERLRAWIEEKERTGIPALPPGAAAGLSREDQSRKLEGFLQRVLAGKGA